MRELVEPLDSRKDEAESLWTSETNFSSFFSKWIFRLHV